MVHVRGCRSVCDAEPKWPHMNNLGDVRQQKQLVCGWEQAPWPELRDLGAGFAGQGGAHMGLLEVPDLLWGRARRGGESWDGALLPLSACDADRKGLLCGRSWGPGLQEERAKLRPYSPRHQVHVAGGFMMQEPKSMGLL